MVAEMLSIDRRKSSDRDYVDQVLEQWAAAAPDADFRAIEVSFRISRAAFYYDAGWAKQAEENGITVGESLILAALRRAGPPFSMRPAEMVKALFVTPSGITRQVERLVARGLVEKARQPSDRRSVTITLTAKGRRVAEAQFTSLPNRIEQRLLLEFTPAERAEFVRLFRKLLLLLEARVPPPIASAGNETLLASKASVSRR
jgi:DNA-binding MarR family transcriptional regulator